MIGRENERTQILRALQRAKEASVARTIRLIGASGVGKSTLVGAATEQARTDGWLAILEPAHRVQVRLPFVVAWRMGAAIVAALGEEHERYTAGLPNDFSAEREGTQIEESLYRLFEGVLHDWPLLLAVDDVQWCDPESLGLLQRLIERFADRRIALLAVERRDEPGWPGLAQSDEAIVLEALSSGEAQQLVRALLPKATDDVVARIAEVSAGRAIDIIAIAESIEAEGAGDIESVTAGVRAVVARDLALLSPERREFLQMLALIEEPISLALLRRLWSEERFVPMLEASTGRYLVAAPDGFLFRHGALAQAVRETIAIEIPYRRRIIAAVSEQATLAIPELEQVIAQAKACGDNALELDYLKRLADAASTANELPLLARALERTIKLTPLSMDVLLPVYSQLSMVYNGLSRELDTIRISQEGISVARASATTAGFGPLVASLVLATWHSGDDATLQSILSTYENFFVLHDELAEIAYARMAVAIFDYDYDDFLKQFEKIGKLVARNAISDLRLATSEALMCARIGNASESARALRRARTIANDLPSALRFMPHAVERLTTFYQSGTSYAIAPSLWTNENRRANTDAAIDALCAASLGNIGDAYEVIRDALVATPGGFETRVLIGLSTSVGLCSGVPIPDALLQAARREASAFLQNGRSAAMVPIAASLAGIDANSNKESASELFGPALSIAERVAIAPQIHFLPLTLAFAARRLDDRDALERIADGSIRTDNQAWSLAHSRLAACWAAVSLGRKPSTTEHNDLKRQFEALGAPFFASFLTLSDREMQSHDGHLKRLSRREREVVALIVEGHTNRQIAEELILSERTIEGHVANVFNKIGATSRAKVAAWFTREASRPASQV